VSSSAAWASGIIGEKIAATLASTPSFFIHPGEAFHGDLGMVKTEGIFLAISNSGEIDELAKLLPSLGENGNLT
jgi:arabinose-5-phosphate isomerase